MLGRRLLGLPGDDEQQRPPAQPVREEEEEPERRFVGPLRVVHEQRTGRPVPERSQEQSADRLVEAHLRGGAVDGPRRGRAELWQQARRLGEPALVIRAWAVRPECGAEQLSGHAVGELALLAEAAHGEHAAAGRGDFGQELVTEPRLADSRLAHDDGESAVRPDRRIGLAEGAELARAADERQRLLGADHGRGRRRGRCGEEGALENGVVERGRLVERPHAELAIEDAHALPVLLECSGAVAAGGVDANQLPVRGLVQRIERKPPLRRGDRARPVAGARERLGKPVERAGHLAAQHLGRELLPVVELGRVAEAEAREERPVVEGDRCAQRLEAALACLARSVPVCLAFAREASAARPRRAGCPRRRVRRAHGRPRRTGHRARSAASRACAATPIGPARGRSRARGATRSSPCAPDAPRSRGTRAERSPCACRPRAAVRPPRHRRAEERDRERRRLGSRRAIVTATVWRLSPVRNDSGCGSREPSVTVPERL